MSALSDDDVVGSGKVNVPHGWDGKNLPVQVHFSDLDDHIQDRLRAAEEMAQSIQLYEEACRLYAEASRSPLVSNTQSKKLKERRRVEMRSAVAAYEATFKEEA